MKAAAVALAIPVVCVVVLPTLFLQPLEVDAQAEVADVRDEIPDVAMQAYLAAAESQAQQDPSCHPSWALLAAIGKVETNHGRHAGSAPDQAGDVAPPIFGVVLDGSIAGTRAVVDTDGGRLDGNAMWDRAVGPMQFLPQTWGSFERDIDENGTADPQNLFDAAGAAAAYLCRSTTTDIGSPAGMRQAIRVYNPSDAYVEEVLAVMEGYVAEAVQSDDLPPTDGWTNPAPTYTRVSSGYGYRIHPISGKRKLHAGIDLSCASGAQIVAAAAGVVVSTGLRGGAGYVVEIDHDGGVRTRYLHLLAGSFAVAADDTVRAGDLLAGCGSTGNSTGPHLHFEVRPGGGSAIDPQPFMAERGVMLQ